MTQSLVPNSQFFENHKKAMIKVIERNQPIFKSCEQDLNDILPVTATKNYQPSLHPSNI